MKPKTPLTTYEFEYEFLKGEFFKNTYNGVRHLAANVDIHLPPVGHQSNKQWKMFIKTLLWIERYVLLSSLQNYDSIEWSTVLISQKEFERIRIIKEKSWAEAFPGCKTVKDVALAINVGHIDNQGHAHKIRQIQLAIKKQAFKERLIMITNSRNTIGSLLEGNHRAVAFMLENIRTKGKFKTPQEIIAGGHKTIKECTWYNGK